MGKFSIITLSLNNKDTIKDNIYSVDKQTYKNIEHLCLDGYSSDGTYEILKKLKKKWRIIKQSRLNGVYSNLNRASKYLKGDYIGLLHSDDIFYDKNVIKKIANKFKNKKINIIYTDINIVKKNNLNFVIRNWIANEKKFSTVKNSEEYKILLKNGWMPAHTGFFFRKKLIKKFNYNIKYEISADYDLMIRMLKNIDGIYYLPIKSTKMRIGGKSSKINKLFKKMNEDLEVIKKNNLNGYSTLAKKIFSKLKQFYKK